MSNFVRFTVTSATIIVGLTLRFAIYHHAGGPTALHHTTASSNKKPSAATKASAASAAGSPPPSSATSSSGTAAANPPASTTKTADAPPDPPPPPPSAPLPPGKIPSSAWIEFSTPGPASDQPTYHSRLLADSTLIDGTEAPPATTSILEVVGSKRADSQIILTLAPLAPAACTAIHSLRAQFDSRPPKSLPVTAAAREGACDLIFGSFDQVFFNLRNASRLVITTEAPSRPQRTVSLNIAGLNWDPDQSMMRLLAISRRMNMLAKSKN